MSMTIKNHIIRFLGTSAFAALLMGGVASHAFAAGGVNDAPSFNSNPNDYEFLQGRNYTQNGAIGDPVTAAANDEVEVRVYYHNYAVPDNAAKNVVIKMSLPSATEISTTHVIKGQLSADNAATVTGSIIDGTNTEIGKPDFTINTPSGPTMVAYEPGTVRWYPNREAQTGKGESLPFGQNGDTIVTTGLNIGDLRGCFEYSGFVVFRVKLAAPVTHTATLRLSKDVRKAGTSDAFINEVNQNAGANVEYRLTLENQAGASDAIARKVTIFDSLPEGISYVGPTFLTRNGVTTQLADGITSAQGLQIMDDLKAQEIVTITFKAQLASTLKNADCRTNAARVTADNATLPTADAKANACAVVPTPSPTPTPMPTPTATAAPLPSATPKPPVQLPKTGPEDGVAGLVGLAGVAGTTARFYQLKRRLKTQARKITII